MRINWASIVLWSVAGMLLGVLAYGYAHSAETQLATPIPQIGTSCPQGYDASAGQCVPRADAKPAILRRDHRCPAGWRQSFGQSCVKN